jgi:hypothetical protein
MLVQSGPRNKARENDQVQSGSQRPFTTGKEGTKMNDSSFNWRSVPVIILMASAPVYAKQSRMVRLPYAASLNGTQLPAGQYKISWERHSPEASVAFALGKNLVTTAAATWVERNVRYPANEVVYSTAADGSRTILEIRFAGVNGVLVFADAAHPKS